MLLINPLFRQPKESEMSISNQVKESVESAANSLRDALAFAARAEHPITISTLSDILCRLETLEHVEDLMEQFSKRNEEKKGPR